MEEKRRIEEEAKRKEEEERRRIEEEERRAEEEARRKEEEKQRRKEKEKVCSLFLSSPFLGLTVTFSSRPSANLRRKRVGYLRKSKRRKNRWPSFAGKLFWLPGSRSRVCSKLQDLVRRLERR